MSRKTHLLLYSGLSQAWHVGSRRRKRKSSRSSPGKWKWNPREKKEGTLAFLAWADRGHACISTRYEVHAHVSIAAYRRASAKEDLQG